MQYFSFCLFSLFIASALGLHKCLYFISGHEDFGSHLLETFILTTSFAIARSDAKEKKVSIGAGKAKLAARRLILVKLHSKNRSNGKDFLMIRAKLNRNGPKTEKQWILHVKR